MVITITLTYILISTNKLQSEGTFKYPLGLISLRDLEFPFTNLTLVYHICGILTAEMSFFYTQVVESGGKNIEVGVVTKEHGLRQLEEAEIDAIVAEIEAEKAAAEAAKKGPSKET